MENNLQSSICDTNNWRFLHHKHLDVSSCGADTFVILPLITLLLGGFLDYFSLRNQDRKDRKSWRGRLLLNLKLAASSISCILALLRVILELQYGPDNLVGNYCRIFCFTSILLSIPLQYVSHTRSRRSSTTLLVYWLLMMIFYLFQLRTFLSSSDATSPPYYPYRFTLLVMLLVSSICVLSLETLCPEDQQVHLSDSSEELDFRESPRETSNAFSRLAFSWVTPMMRKGHKSYIDESDLWSLPHNQKTENVSKKFNYYLKKELKKEHPHLLKVLVCSFGTSYLFAGFIKLGRDVFAFVQPQLLKRFLTFVHSRNLIGSGVGVDDDAEPIANGIVLAGMMFASATFQDFLFQHSFQASLETGMRVRSAVIMAIYEKSLKLSTDERMSRPIGDIVNLQSTDAYRLQSFCAEGVAIWSVAFQLTLAFISLHRLFGICGLVGVLIMIFPTIANTFIARILSRLQFRQMKVKDSRSRLMCEILNNIKSIKLYAWESAFSKKIFHIRNDMELPLLRKIGLVNSSSNFILSFSPFLVSFATFAAYSVVSGKPLTADIVFPGVLLLRLLASPITSIPSIISTTVEAYVSIQRVTNFLNAKELQPDALVRKNREKVPIYGDKMLRAKSGEFAWSSSTETVLRDINITLTMGEFISVVGKIGSGKSSLLSALIGEMAKKRGSVSIYGSLAYVPQQAWIMGGTVKENILFGHVYDHEFYQKTLEACALIEDIEIFYNGDETEVGEKGLILSGGQKARLALARAVYARADIYLLDDPLSAVDSLVGRHLYDNVIGPSGLLGSKARIICTNTLPFVKDSDLILSMNNGYISQSGSYEQILNDDSSLGELLREHAQGPFQNEKDNEEQDQERSKGQRIPNEPDVATSGKHLSSSNISRTLYRPAELTSNKDQRQVMLRNTDSSSIRPEHIERGSVDFSVYKRYIRANGLLGVFFYFFFIVAQQGFSIGGNVWLKNWTQNNNQADENIHLGYYLGIYFAFGLVQSLCGLLNVVVLYCLCIIRSARIMHDQMFKAVMRSPMMFFETTPIGMVLNRFTRDIYTTDSVLARNFGNFFGAIISVAGVFVVIGSSTPIFLLIGVPLAFLYRSVQLYYLESSRELKRLLSITRSPIFNSFSETLIGLSTIRAFDQTSRFSVLHEAKIERNQEVQMLSSCASRWLGVRLRAIGSFLILSTAGAAVLTLSRGGNLSSGLAGLMMSYALDLTQSLNKTVRTSTDIEMNIVSVERVSEYAELPPEAPLEIKETKPDDGWPAHGCIEFKDFSMRYRSHLDPVLKNVSFSVEPKAKIGICGRTGAGKSSLMMSIFRIVEGGGGRIIIDGVDISKIGLHDLRSRLSIIPQDSQCFDGTIRENVDPIGFYDDHDIWRVLEQARLKDHVLQMTGLLDARVEEGGRNLSAGQRQLMCLARALLRRSKILVLDEATSSADLDTDREVQEIIRREFVDCTILTIAHRLDTILDSSRVLVMRNGTVAEYDVPRELFKREGSTFQSLCRQANIDGW